MHRLAAFLLVAAVHPLVAAERPPAAPVVAKLYRDFAWEAVIVEPRWPDEGLLDQPTAVLRRYFDERLTTLIRADRECVARTKEICSLDFSPISE